MTKEYWQSAPVYEVATDVARTAGGVPVRAMEVLPSHGAGAVELLRITVRAYAQQKVPECAHWSIVALGVMRDPAALPELLPLLETATRHGRVGLGFATAEALARIGDGVEPELLKSAARTPPFARLWHYYAAARVRSDGTAAFLVDELERNPRLADAIVLALADQRRLDALPAVGRVLKRLRPWQRGAVEMAVRALHHDTQVLAPYTCDWRLRYRFHPRYGFFPPLWPCIAALVRSSASYRTVCGAVLPQRTLDELLALPPVVPPPPACVRCGRTPGRVRAGVESCDGCAADIARTQSECVLEIGRPFGSEDVFDVLDWVDILLERAESEPADRGPAFLERAPSYYELVVARGACHWLIEQGYETATAGAAALLVESEGE